MSQENVELARNALDAFHRRDREAFLALCDPDYEWVPPADWPETAPVRGPEAVWAFLVELDEPWETGEYKIAEIIDCGNRVAMHVRRHVRGRTSGVEADFDYWPSGPRATEKGCGRNGSATAKKLSKLRPAATRLAVPLRTKGGSLASHGK